MIFLLAIPAMVTNYILLDFYPNPIYYLTFFIYGYVLIADARFQKAIDRDKTIALVLGLALYIVWISMVTRDVIDSDWLQPIPGDLIGWFSLVAVLGYGKRFLSFTNRLLKYAGEASYPLYILHQTAIVIIGYYVVRWDASVLVKFVMIVVTSFVTSVVLYDLLVKRTNVTRFLFGMRPKRVEAPAERRREAIA
jgi:peptidoglycan/LPS O-acetylase OafA/YrhL